MKIDPFALFCFLKKLNSHIIESGVWKGQTTWLIKVLKIQNLFNRYDLSNREVIYDDVNYLNKESPNITGKN